MEAIDLTLGDDEVFVPPAKRARPNDGGDNDVEVVEEPHSAPGASSQASEKRELGDDEELLVTKQIGQVRG